MAWGTYPIEHDPAISYYYHNEGLLISVKSGSPFPVVIVGNDLNKISIGKLTLENAGKITLEESLR